ncbi:MAG TPA: hypothetical protein VHP37_16690 [Burkholderiales bacterium]|nr:hypothetical protein [Burkholderiales bacterium]
MSERDDYVARMNSQLDAWNKQFQDWQEKAKQAQAGQKAEYERQLDLFRQRRDDAMEQLRKVQNASGDAWLEMMKGADQAWNSMREAYERASERFYK